MLLVSDVHGAFDDLARVAGTGETLLILGDLINLLDYRTGEGIVSEVMGSEFGKEAAVRRGEAAFGGIRTMWNAAVAGRVGEVDDLFDAAFARDYEECRRALQGAVGYVTYGNVDRPPLLALSLPDSMRFVDGEVVEVDGYTVGFAGGGVTTPLAAQGEVTDDAMAEKLSRLAGVDILCTHVPPDVSPLRTDVITGRAERASWPVLDFLNVHQPAFHFFGDVHQPQASTWRIGRTHCRNVGYFRATKRPVRLMHGVIGGTVQGVPKS